MSDQLHRQLRIPVRLWVRMLGDVRHRGHGRRESGAFLLGNRNHAQDCVRRYLCYDDLDPHALDSGIVVMRACGFGKLWTHCRKSGLQVLADVHTHGDTAARQSPTDQHNPMIGEIGHVALILPCFAQTWCWNFHGVGIYEYRGGYQWHAWHGRKRRQRVRFSWW